MKLHRLTVLVAILIACSCSGTKKAQDDSGAIAINTLDLAESNLELAKNGRLAENIFKSPQVGTIGLLPEWDRNSHTGEILSDVYWEMGYVAYAQRMAFEANITSDKEYVPEMVERLVQTNLIFGAYPVVEKYLRVLEADGRDCSHYRALLYNDAAVAADAELGPKKACLPENDEIALMDGLDGDLKKIIRRNPTYHRAVEYLGVMYLLDCNMDAFKQMLDEFYGTPALETLPKSFAEAACMLSELEHNYWKKVNVDKKTWLAYRDFKSRIESGLSQEKYNDTFWYYIMRRNAE